MNATAGGKCTNLKVFGFSDTSLELWLATGGGVLHVLIIKRLNGSLGLDPGESVGAKEAHRHSTQPGRLLTLRNIRV